MHLLCTHANFPCVSTSGVNNMPTSAVSESSNEESRCRCRCRVGAGSASEETPIPIKTTRNKWSTKEAPTRMSKMALTPAYPVNGLQFDISQLERIILTLVDRYDIRIFAQEALPDAKLAVGLAAIGGLIGLYFGGKVGMITGAVGGVGTAVFISVRDKWAQVKEKLSELYFIVYNYLRSLKVGDYIAVGDVLYKCAKNRELLVRTIVEFIAMKLGTKVMSSIANGH